MRITKHRNGFIQICLKGIDTAGLRGVDYARGYAARDHLRDMISRASRFVIETEKSGKHDRWLGIVWALYDDKDEKRAGIWANLSGNLVEAGHVVPYMA